MNAEEVAMQMAENVCDYGKHGPLQPAFNQIFIKKEGRDFLEADLVINDPDERGGVTVEASWPDGFIAFGFAAEGGKHPLFAS